MYSPDKWIVLEIELEDGEKVKKVLGVWSGGYLSGDSWRINSGIKKITQDEDYFYFHGFSGSVYKCNKWFEVWTSVMSEIVSRIGENYKVTLVPAKDLEVCEDLEDLKDLEDCKTQKDS